MARLVEILAKEMDVWPNGAVYAVQDGDARKTIKFGKKEAGLGIQALGHHLTVWQCPKWDFTSKHDFDHSDLADDFKEAVVYMAQWQAERDKQKGGEWKRHRGGKQPVADDVRVEVKLRDGDIQEAKASAFLWNHSDCDVYANIMQYRVISQPQAEEIKLSKAEARAPFRKPVIVYPEAAEAKTDQIDGPIKWRDAVNELDAYIEEYTREREALINRLALEGFALIPAMTAVMGVADYVDMGDWRNWKIGDHVRVAQENDEGVAVGTVTKVTRLEHHDYRGDLPVMIEGDRWPGKLDENESEAYNILEFIRRP